MAEIIQLEPDVAVARQLVEADFADIAARGYQSVVAVRPDGEAPDQLPQARAAAAAMRQGLTFRYLPVTGVKVTDDEIVHAFARLMDDLPGPVLFYCGTSTRCTILWAQAAAPRLGVDAALAGARRAGQDLDFMRETLVAHVDWGATIASPAHAQAASSAASGAL